MYSNYRHLEERGNARHNKACVKEWFRKNVKIFILKESPTITGATVYIAGDVKQQIFAFIAKAAKNSDNIKKKFQ